MSKAFNQAISERAVKLANIYFHRQHAVAAQELGARIAADAQGQAHATRTQGDLVRGPNDVQSCDSIIIDRALGAAQAQVIIDLHDAVKYPYEVHYIVFDPMAGVFNMDTESENVQATSTEAARVHTNSAGTAESDGPRATAPPADDSVRGDGGQRTRGRAGRGSGG